MKDLFFNFLDIFIIYITSVIPFPNLPSENFLSLAHPPPTIPTHSLLIPGPGILQYRGIEPSQEQGALLLLMTA